MKRRSVLFSLAISLFLAVFLLNIVSAQYGSIFPGNIDLGQGMQQIINQITGFFTPIFALLLGPYRTYEFFYAKVMLLILLSIIIYVILERLPIFEGYRGITSVVSIVVSVIAVRFISENNIITGILLPYGTLGIAITALLPFLIFAYGIHHLGLSGLGRKIGWGFFGIVFIVLWVYRTNDPTTQISPIADQIYLWTLVAIAIMLVFDRTIHAYFRGLEIKKFEKESNESEIVNLQNQLAEIITASRAGPLARNQEERKIKLERKLRHLGAKYTRY